MDNQKSMWFCGVVSKPIHPHAQAALDLRKLVGSDIWCDAEPGDDWEHLQHATRLLLAVADTLDRLAKTHTL